MECETADREKGQELTSGDCNQDRVRRIKGSCTRLSDTASALIDYARMMATDGGAVDRVSHFTSDTIPFPSFSFVLPLWGIHVLFLLLILETPFHQLSIFHPVPGFHFPARRKLPLALPVGGFAPPLISCFFGFSGALEADLQLHRRSIYPCPTCPLIDVPKVL